MTGKPVLRLAFSDFWDGFEASSWPPIRALSSDFSVELSRHADVLVCGPYGRRHVLHKATKVFWSHEPWEYEPSEYDFTVGFDPLDKTTHLRFPNYVSHLIGDALDGRAAAHPSYESWRQRPHFCNFIYANATCPERNAFFHALSRRREVLSPGRVSNNTTPIPGGRTANDWRLRKVAYQQSFRFTIAFENVQRPGYTSEKAVDALSAGTIPVYWGNPHIGDDLDRRAFIAASDFGSFDELADYVCAVDKDEKLARGYLESAHRAVRPVDDWVAELIGFFRRVVDFSIAVSPRRLRMRAVRLTAGELGRLAHSRSFRSP